MKVTFLLEKLKFIFILKFNYCICTYMGHKNRTRTLGYRVIIATYFPKTKFVWKKHFE